MQPDSRTRGLATRQPLLLYLAAALIVYGALGVAVHLRLLPLVVQGLASWLGPPPASSPPPSIPPLSLLQGHYDALPWLPWAAWLAGAGILGVVVRRSSGAPSEAEPDATQPNTFGPHRRWLLLGLLLVLLLIGGYARMSQLWPQGYGLSQLPYDDEGVYAGTSQLFIQGIMPYRDYFFAHPPIAAFSYAPAMAYHFTEWGSPTSFMMARYLSVAYSLLTLAILFLIGVRLAGVWGGAISSALWALDGRVVEINRKVMLDGPMVLLSCGALLLYLWVRPTLAGDTSSPAKRPLVWLALAGACAAMSALTKIAGAACFIAILADIIWIAVVNRRAADKPQVPRFRLQLGSLLLGAVAATLAILGPFLVMAPSQFVRYVFFFQVLRPSDGTIDVPSRIADLTLNLGNALTPLLAAVGFAFLSLWVWNRRQAGPWRVVVLWTFFSLLLFTYSRSFYGHYYIQLAAPLCLLGAGVSLLPSFLSLVETGRRSVAPAMARLSPVALLALIALPLVAVQWGGIVTRREDRIFEIVGRYAGDAVPPGSPILSTDEQFNFLAARPPSRNATGYLIDSYGHMIALGLGLNTRDWPDLWAASLRGEHSDDAYAIMQRPTPQADFLDRASRAPLIVIHSKGYARLTQSTIDAIEAQTSVAERQARYTIYRNTSP
ncbi:MAG TPA: hypothetical protein VGE45_15020 [Chloroflexia bacterium]